MLNSMDITIMDFVTVEKQTSYEYFSRANIIIITIHNNILLPKHYFQ